MKCTGLLLACLIPFVLFAQKNFQPGYIVTLEGDTINGSIDYKEWDFTPTRILFRPSGNNSGQKEYSVNDISFFHITGNESYRRSIVKISLHPEKLANIGGRDTSWKIDTVFLKILYAGKVVSLLSYSDQIKERFYICVNGNEQPEELIVREYLMDGSMSLISENLYRSQLKATMYSINFYSDRLDTKIQEAAYELRDLKKIVLLMNRADDHELESYNKSHTNWFAGIGIQRDNISFEGEHFFAGNEASTSLTWLPKFSAGVDVFANPGVGKLFFRLEAGYQLNKSNVSTSGWNKTRRYELASSTVSIVPQINYTLYNTPKLKIPAGVGFGYSVMMYSKNQYKELSPTGEEFSRNNNFLELRKGIVTLLARASVVYNNKIEASFLYRPQTSFTTYQFFSLGGSNMQFQVYYLFRNKM